MPLFHIYFVFLWSIWGFPGGSDGKKICLQCGVRFPWRRECLPTPVFLPGEFHGQRSLVGYRPWGRKESDATLTSLGLLEDHINNNTLFTTETTPVHLLITADGKI